ncbi:MAG TPA: hypothetical protein VIS99_15675, partial [Terrimicrobiaceae bacterium]
ADLGSLGAILERTPDSVKIEVSRGSVADLCRVLLDRAPVADLTVGELPIEDVIRKIFGKKSS